MTGSAYRRSTRGLVLLALLAEEPMHPYRMQQLIKQRHKDTIANVAQRNSVYQTIDSLRRAGLITVLETAREPHRPERTVYQITDQGTRTLRLWLLDMLATPAREFPEFPAALSELALLPPHEVLESLQRRAVTVAENLAVIDDTLATPPQGIPRLFLLEEEYRAAVLRAELEWVRSVIHDLAAGDLHWDAAWVREIAANAQPAREASIKGRGPEQRHTE